MYQVGNDIGVVTSGGFGPTVKGPIAMGYVNTANAVPGTTVNLLVDGKKVSATITKMPFVQRRYVRPSKY